jgi:hypothetical protein
VTADPTLAANRTQPPNAHARSPGTTRLTVSRRSIVSRGRPSCRRRCCHRRSVCRRSQGVARAGAARVRWSVPRAAR